MGKDTKAKFTYGMGWSLITCLFVALAIWMGDKQQDFRHQFMVWAIGGSLASFVCQKLDM